MMRRVPAWGAAPLLAAFAVLRVAASSPGQYAPGDFLLTLAAVVVIASAVAAGVHFSAARLGGRPETVRMVDLFFAGAVALFFLGASLAAAFHEVTGHLLRVRFIFLALLLGVGGAWIRRSTFVVVTRFVTTAAVLLVAGTALQLALGMLASHREPSMDRLVARLGSPVPTRNPTAPDSSVDRDIYLLVLDARANAEALRTHFGYVDSGFTDSLRRIGFVVPTRFRSNYAWTALSLPSLLNFTYVNELHADGDASRSNAAARALVRHNRAAAFLKSRGYHYQLFPSEWYSPTRDSPLADYTFRALPPMHPRRILATEFRRGIFGGTPIERLSWLGDPTSHPRRSLAALARVADDPRATFVVAHVLLPHEPYLFGEGCEPQRQDRGQDLEATKRLYIRQLRCTNDLVLSAITGILERPGARPIIAIVGDHGSRLSHFEGAEGRVDARDALEEQYAAFGAFLTPDAPELFAGELTLVNVMQRLLETYFDADIEPSPDRFFASDYRTRFTLKDVTAELATREGGDSEPPPIDFP